MTSRMTIYDHFCKPITEMIAPTVTPRSWVTDEYGRCEFSLGYYFNIPQVNQKASQRNLQFGNLIHIEHIPTDSNHGKLPSWTGIILPPRNWDKGIIHVTAYSAESILAFRAMPYISVKNTPANVFKQIIEYSMQQARNIIFKTDFVEDMPITFPDDLRINGYDHIRKIIKDCNMNWDVIGSINSKGNLELSANLYRKRGIDTGFVINSDNSELANPLLTEQGTPSNQVFGYSQEQTAQKRVMAIAINQAAYDDYGPLQLNQVYMGKHDANSVYQSALNKVMERGRPVKIVKRNVLDKGKSFDNLRIGNIVTVKDTTVGFNPNGKYGFESKAKILSIDYNDLSNKVPVNLELING